MLALDDSRHFICWDAAVLRPSPCKASFPELGSSPLSVHSSPQPPFAAAPPRCTPPRRSRHLLTRRALDEAEAAVQVAQVTRRRVRHRAFRHWFVLRSLRSSARHHLEAVEGIGQRAAMRWALQRMGANRPASIEAASGTEGEDFCEPHEENDDGGCQDEKATMAQCWTDWRDFATCRREKRLSNMKAYALCVRKLTAGPFKQWHLLVASQAKRTRFLADLLRQTSTAPLHWAFERLGQKSESSLEELKVEEDEHSSKQAHPHELTTPASPSCNVPSSPSTSLAGPSQQHPLLPSQRGAAGRLGVPELGAPPNLRTPSATGERVANECGNQGGGEWTFADSPGCSNEQGGISQAGLHLPSQPSHGSDSPRCQPQRDTEEAGNLQHGACSAGRRNADSVGYASAILASSAAHDKAVWSDVRGWPLSPVPARCHQQLRPAEDECVRQRGAELFTAAVWEDMVHQGHSMPCQLPPSRSVWSDRPMTPPRIPATRSVSDAARFALSASQVASPRQAFPQQCPVEQEPNTWPPRLRASMAANLTCAMSTPPGWHNCNARNASASCRSSPRASSARCARSPRNSSAGPGKVPHVQSRSSSCDRKRAWR